MELTLNHEEKLYVIPCGEGYTCLGFDVLEKRSQSLSYELQHVIPVSNTLGITKEQLQWEPNQPPTKSRYEQYQNLVHIAHQWNQATGWKSKTELTDSLCGLEGQYIEVIDCYDQIKRFKVGRSTGWIPIHIEISSKIKINGKFVRQFDDDDDGLSGCAVTGAPFKRISILRGNKYVRLFSS